MIQSLIEYHQIIINRNSEYRSIDLEPALNYYL